MDGLRIRVPASTANLGPGFDSLALALGLYNSVELTRGPQGYIRVEVHGEGQDVLPADHTNAVVRAMKHVCDREEAPFPSFELRCQNGIPPEGGLGSSAAAYAVGAAAARALLGIAHDADALFEIVAELEGHPDNASATVYGGLVAAGHGEHGLIARKLRLAGEMKVVVALPEIRLATHQQRALLPDCVPLPDAARNIGRALLVVEAFATADYNLLAQAMRDQLHEPHRLVRIPGYAEVMQAARQAGAAAVALSGSGPSLVAFAPSCHDAIAQAMRGAFQRAGVAAQAWVLPVDNDGVALEALH